MTKADQTVETAADKLEDFVRDARRSGGVKAKVGEALADDPEFLRKLKPSLIKARAKGELPTDEPAPTEIRHPDPSPGANGTKPKKKSGGGPSPFLDIGAALAVGYMLAKVIDWRGHAHPRR
jgi:hypothetical protein